MHPTTEQMTFRPRSAPPCLPLPSATVVRRRRRRHCRPLSSPPPPPPLQMIGTGEENDLGTASREEGFISRGIVPSRIWMRIPDESARVSSSVQLSICGSKFVSGITKTAHFYVYTMLFQVPKPQMMYCTSYHRSLYVVTSYYSYIWLY